jgi:large subunit ribosomal protein L19e
MNLRYQRRMAAQVLGIGKNRVRMNPEKVEDIADSITRSSIRAAIGYGAIQVKPKRGISSGRRKYARDQKKGGRRRGPGSREGGRNARTPSKRAWMQRIRPIRRRLKQLRDDKKVTTRVYRTLYLQAKGGMFKSLSHLNTQMRMQGLIKEGD